MENDLVSTRYSDSLTILDYQNNLPIVNNALNRANNYWVSSRFKKYLKRVGVTDFLLWAFDPTRLYDPGLLGAKLGIFHCVDFYYFSFLGETELCRNSDLIFATSQRFLDEYKDFDAPKYVVPHGISSEEFALDPTEKSKVLIPVHDFALYVGKIDHRIDFELLGKALQRFPEIPFLFVGPMDLPDDPAARQIFEERRHANLQTVGPKHFKTLKYYVDEAKFCISFMDMNYHGNTVHHHKTLVYLCQGKPVFSPRFSEYSETGDGLIYMDDSHEGLLSKIEEFVRNGEDHSLRERRVEYARQFGFESILEGVEKILRGHNFG